MNFEISVELFLLILQLLLKAFGQCRRSQLWRTCLEEGGIGIESIMTVVMVMVVVTEMEMEMEMAVKLLEVVDQHH